MTIPCTLVSANIDTNMNLIEVFAMMKHNHQE